jgi:transposase
MTAAADRPYLKELYSYVQSVKGIGPAIAMELLLITARRPGNEFKAITDPKKLAASAVRLPRRSSTFCLFIRSIQRES